MDFLEPQDFVDHLDPKVMTDVMDLQVYLVYPDKKVTEVVLARCVHPEQKAKRAMVATLVCPGHKANEVYLEFTDHKATPEMMD